MIEVAACFVAAGVERLPHFAIQMTVKVIVFPHGAESFAIGWMIASALVPLMVFTVKARRP